MRRVARLRVWRRERRRGSQRRRSLLRKRREWSARCRDAPNPSVNPGAIHLQTLGDLTGGLPLDAEHDGLQSQGDAGRLVSLGCLAKSLKPREGSRIAVCEDGLHGWNSMLFYLYAFQFITFPRRWASKKGTFNLPKSF